MSLHGHDKIGEGCCLLCSVSRAGGVCGGGGGEGAGRVPVFKLTYMRDGNGVKFFNKCVVRCPLFIQ